MENKIFKKFILNIEKLEPYGFKKEGGEYIIRKSFMNNEFFAVIKIDKNGVVKGYVFDSENSEEYLPLKLVHTQSTYAAEVRNSYEKILIDIRNNCFSENLFISPQANRIADKIFELYGNRPEFLWEKFPTYGVFRNSISKKWYCIIMNINHSKLDKNKSGEVEIINLKTDENEIKDLLKIYGFYRAWHMNKKSWVSILLDNTLKDDAIIKYIQKSHKLTQSK